MSTIKKTPKEQCQECKRIAECRPYGKGGMKICFDCAMKDEDATKRMMNQFVFGDKPN